MMWWKNIALLKRQLRDTQAELEKEQRTSAQLSGFIGRLQTLGISPTGRVPSQELAQTLIDSVYALVQAEQVILFRVTGDGQDLFPEAARGFSPEVLDHLRIRLGEGSIGRAARDLKPSEGPSIDFLDSRHLLIPLQSQAQCTGALLMAKPKDGTFSIQAREMATLLAAQAALLVESHKHYVDIETLREQAVSTLARVIEAKDKITLTHSDRTRALVRSVAGELSLPEVLIRQIEYGAFLHDIGKIGIEDAILKKTGPLTPEEYTVMKNHPLIGLNILKPLSYLRSASAIVLYHQEWHNGTGYPEGLAGDEIPLGARIVQVIDAWDAMTSNRAYRKAMPARAAIAELRRQAGTQFDPKIVDIFLRVVDRLEREGIPTTEEHHTMTIKN